MIALAALVAAMLQMMPAGVTTIEQGALSNVSEGRQVVVRTDAEWATLWQQHGGERKRPAIDFSKDMVLGVFMGTRPTAGFRIDVLTAKPHEGKLVVRYRQTMPKRDAMTAQVITSPFHLVAVPKFSGEIVFEKAEPGK